MTSNYHTPIPASPKQEANAATFNAPLAQLDQVITESLTEGRTDFGKRYLSVLINATVALESGNGAAYLPRVPADFDTWEIVGVYLCRVSGTGTMSVQLYNGSDDILSTALSLDTDELDSKDAATPAVVDPSQIAVTTGMRIRVDVDDEGTDSLWCEVGIVLLPAE
jgi:hypothetical protein